MVLSEMSGYQLIMLAHFDTLRRVQVTQRRGRSFSQDSVVPDARAGGYGVRFVADEGGS